MSYWDNDRWRDSYDEWKLRSPDDELPEEECYHEEYEADINGRATCYRCGDSWWMSSAETEAERANVAAYERQEKWQLRRRRFTAPFRWAWYHTMSRIWPRRACDALYLDEIPF